VVTAAGIGLVVMVVNWLLAHWWVLVVLVLAGLAGAGWLSSRQQRVRWEAVRAQGLRYGLPQLDALHHTRFEDAVRDLMQRDGCQDAQRVGGRGVLGADVKATDPYGRRWVIQCKHRRNGARGSPVGTPDLQVLNGTARPVHGADVAVIVTNGRGDRPGRHVRQAAAAARRRPPDPRRLGVRFPPPVGAPAGGTAPAPSDIAELKHRMDVVIRRCLARKARSSPWPLRPVPPGFPAGPGRRSRPNFFTHHCAPRPV
jgi:restriction system protein